MFTKMIAVVTSISLVFSHNFGLPVVVGLRLVCLIRCWPCLSMKDLYLSFEEFGDSRENCRLRSVCPMIS